jgi:IS30 family transposase
MTKSYTQLSLHQRYQIQVLLQAGKNQEEIAELLGRSPSTISRELKRNIPKRGRGAGHYKAELAQLRTDKRHYDKAKRMVFDDTLKDFCRYWLVTEKYSPEQIRVKGIEQFGQFVSHETMYAWIWAMKQSNKRADIANKTLYQHLRHGKRRRKRGARKDSRGTIIGRVSIEKRPAIVSKRKRLGDIEIDLMMGKDHKGALLVMTDRACLKTYIRKVNGKSSDEVTRKINSALKKHKHWLKTVTFDNDKAFSMHNVVSKKLDVDTYFTRPYTSQDKGTVENRIGVIRRFFPKKTDLTFITDQEVQRVEDNINNRPIRKFNYKSANQIYSMKIALIT